MRPERKLKSLAQRLVHLSLGDNGLLSEDKVSEVLRGLAEAAPSRHRLILRAYRNEIERELRHSTAIIEQAGALSEETVQNIRQSLEREYNRPLQVERKDSAALIGGLRIRVGDDVINHSIAGRLERLLAHSR